MDPIQPQHKALMNKIMAVLDQGFSGMSITLLIAEPNSVADIAAGRDRRLNYISNSDRATMVTVMREFIARHEGRHFEPSKQQKETKQ